MFFRVFRWFRRLVYLVVFVAFAYLVVNSAQVVTASRTSLTLQQVKPAAAIVVIGSATGSGALSADMHLRCEEAVSLYRSKRAKVVYTTGAAASAACLKSEGVKGVTMVPLSEIPAQLSFIGALLPASGDRHVIFVADPLQTKWLEDVAKAENLDAQVAAVPAPKGTFWHDVAAIWDQTIAVGLGRLVGYKSTGWIGG